MSSDIQMQRNSKAKRRIRDVWLQERARKVGGGMEKEGREGGKKYKMKLYKSFKHTTLSGSV